MPRIFHQIIIEAPSSKVYEAITSQSGLSKWWIKDCQAKAKLGHVNIFTAAGLPPTKMKITSLQLNEEVKWKCVEGNPDWRETEVHFILKEEFNNCTLQFIHSKWKEENEFFATCNFHWARHLILLQKLCEENISMLDPLQEQKEISKVKRIN